jgi:hypothetical protein
MCRCFVAEKTAYCRRIFFAGDFHVFYHIVTKSHAGGIRNVFVSVGNDSDKGIILVVVVVGDKGNTKRTRKTFDIHCGVVVFKIHFHFIGHNADELTFIFRFREIYFVRYFAFADAGKFVFWSAPEAQKSRYYNNKCSDRVFHCHKYSLVKRFYKFATNNAPYF